MLFVFRADGEEIFLSCILADFVLAWKKDKAVKVFAHIVKYKQGFNLSGFYQAYFTIQELSTSGAV